MNLFGAFSVFIYPTAALLISNDYNLSLAKLVDPKSQIKFMHCNSRAKINELVAEKEHNSKLENNFALIWRLVYNMLDSRGSKDFFCHLKAVV